jgi:hypothetical protein
VLGIYSRKVLLIIFAINGYNFVLLEEVIDKGVYYRVGIGIIIGTELVKYQDGLSLIVVLSSGALIW